MFRITDNGRTPHQIKRIICITNRKITNYRGYGTISIYGDDKFLGLKSKRNLFLLSFIH